MCMYIITLCVYAQQGYMYAFGCVSLCTFMLTKNRLFSDLLLKSFLLGVIYCLLFEFKRLHVVCYVQRAVQTGQFISFQIRRKAP